MRKRWLIATIIASWVGIAVASLTAYQRLNILQNGLIKKSFCAINDYINCDAVNASSYAEVLGIPNAWWGTLFYFFIFLLAIHAYRSKKDRTSGLMLAFAMCVGSIGYSLYLGYVSTMVLHTLCIECMTMYVVNIVLLVSVMMALHVKRLGGWISAICNYAQAILQPANVQVSYPLRIKVYVIWMMIVFIPGYVAMYLVQKSVAPNSYDVSLKDVVAYHFQQPQKNIPVDLSRMIWGNPEGKLVVVEISDFQCPFCRVAAFNVKGNLQEYKNDIQFYFLNFPLSAKCNPHVERDMHPNSCLATRAAICAESFGQFWPMHDWMFRHQHSLTRDRITAVAEKAGVPADTFEACLYSPETNRVLASDVKLVNDLQVTGTPAIYINGRPINGWQEPKMLRAIVKAELEK